MADFTVEVDHSKLDVRLAKIEPSVRTALRDVVEILDQELINVARAMAPVRTGKYRASIQGSVQTSGKSVVGKVYSDSPLAHIEEEGARIPPHEILPDAARVLHFGGSAGDVFAAHVHSPGATLPARHIIEGAFEEMTPEIRERLEDAVRGAIQEV